MNWILAILRRPHPGYANLSVYFAISTTTAAGVFLILSFLQPFNLGNRNILGNPYITALVYAGGSYIIMLINFFWIKLFPRSFSDEKWTLGKEILMCIYQMISIATAMWLINYIRGVFPPNIHGYLDMLWIVVSVGFFPYLVVLLIRHTYLVKRSLQKAATMNISLMLDNKEAPLDNDPQYISLQRFIKPIDINTFISAESKGDYLVVNIAHNGKVEELAVTTTLEEFQTENEHFEQLFRCRDEVIINKNKITWVEGNAAGYRLRMHPKLPSVFVSGEKAAEFRKQMDYC
ncbi:MAG: LytTR family transcriptional regulator DNA-binding domain-containing protein [Petrimonas sp.]|uniref:LytTR family transcriptional regulator DNA-binding domain-containing protein n=1 Tax=Petrimonas sp. TaxID=2023866 RepID=UPI002B3A56C7|nr:LytTR family transcriptional regulator DNA-binding domain-containing protein [Petrimonas sp.]MEA4950592.1 LytTR family transcriptional regulator DNA-binding domain-containing protein [Petrimonas sp.]MEA5045053.1 LytTR family transcriptional regulator DNA-binding domain-containing protein [Petrimonas sp.]MEA5063131.1 LytTR family transcriptional regulator DNA-binding domain-containing protein [Petrimonas sp.]